MIQDLLDTDICKLAWSIDGKKYYIEVRRIAANGQHFYFDTYVEITKDEFDYLYNLFKNNLLYKGKLISALRNKKLQKV